MALRPLRGLVILDEVQRRPDLFPTLRVLADRRPLPARFLVLGSASPVLLRQASESLAGRISFHELPGLSLAEAYSGAELDLLVVRGSLRLGFELKRTVSPGVTPSMRIARESLRLKRLDVIHAGDRTGDLAEGIRAVALERLLEDLDPLG